MSEFKYRISVKDDGTAKINKFSKALDKNQKSVEGNAKAMQALKSAGAGLAGVFAVGKLVSFGKATMEAQDGQAKFARQLGISIEELAGLQHAMSLNNVDASMFERSMNRLTMSLNQAGNGTGSAYKAFEALGVQMKDASGQMRRTDDIVLDLADRFSKMENGTRKAALAQDIFGRSGAGIVNVLNEGSEALREQIREGQVLTGVTADNVQSMEDFNTAIGKLKVMGVGVFNQLYKAGRPLFDQISLAVETISEWQQKQAVLNEINEQGEKAALRLALTQIQYLKQREKIGYELTESQKKFIQQTQKNLPNLQKAAKVSEDEYTLMVQKAILAQKIRIENELGITQNKSAQESEIARLESKLSKKKSELDVEALLAKSEEDRAKQAELEKMRQAKRLEFLKEQHEIVQRQKKQEEAVFNFKMNEWQKEQDFAERKLELQAELATLLLSDHERELKAIEDRFEYFKEFLGEEAQLVEWRNGELIRIENERQEKILSEEIRMREEAHAVAMRLAEEQFNRYMQGLSEVGQIAGNISQVMSIQRQKELGEINATYTAEAKRIKDAADLRLQTETLSARQKTRIAEQTEKQLNELAQEREKAEQEAREKSFGLQKAMSITEAIMNGAVAFTNALKTGIPPFNLALAGTIGALTTAQVGLIASQKFAGGGQPIGKNAIIQVNENGQEGVLNAGAMRTLGSGFLQKANSGATTAEMAEMLGNNSGKNVNLNIEVTGFMDERSIQTVLIPAVQRGLRAVR